MSDIDRVALVRRRDQIDKALLADEALKWLLRYGHQGIGASGDGVVGTRHRVIFTLSLGSACLGVIPATRYLNAAANAAIVEIIEAAIKAASDDLEAVKGERL